MAGMQSPGLFRPESLQGRCPPALGGIQINTPPAFWALTLIATAFVGAASAYLFLGHYTRRATVEGMLVPAAGLVTLSATGPGEVLRVDVRQGEEVAAGQRLAELDNPLYSAALGNTQAFITSELNTEREGLEQDLKAQESLAASQASSLRTSAASLRAQLEQIQGQLALQRQEASAMAALLERITPLSKEGYISVYELQQQQANTFNAEVQVKELQRQHLTIEQQLASSEQQLRQIPLKLTAQQTDTRNKLAQVAQALAQNEAQRAWVLTAQRAGVIGTLLIKPGQAVTAGEPLLTVVPVGSSLEAQLLVPSSAIGFVRRGQRVVLRYEAFPYQKFGLQFGTVDGVSRSALLPQEVIALVGEQTSTPLYRVLVRLKEQSLVAYGERVGLRPGMALQADILLDRRRLLEWVLEPLYGFGRRMLAAPRAQPASSSALLYHRVKEARI